MWRPIDELVAVDQRAPLDAPAVDLDAVERAVVEHAYAALLVGDQRMTARDGRVVEADVGGQRAADPRPFPADRAHDDAAVLLEREVAPGTAEARSRLLEPRRGLCGPADRLERIRADARQGAGGLGVIVESWVHQDSFLPGSDRPLRSGSIKLRGLGSRPQLGRALHRQGSALLRRIPDSCPTPRFSKPFGPPELSFVRSSMRALAGGRAGLRALPSHAAGGRDGVLLRRADGLRAVPAAAARGARAASEVVHSAEHELTRQAPVRRLAALFCAANGPRHRARHDRPASRGGLRVPRGHRQPPGVLRPLPQGVAADAGRVLRPWRRRALQDRRAAGPLRAGAT